MQTQPNHTRSISNWIWAGFFIVLGMGVLLALFAGFRGAIQFAEHRAVVTEKLPPSVTAVIKVTLAGGQSVYIEPTAIEHIRTQTNDWIEARRGTEIPVTMLDTINRKVDAIFDAANQQVPAFADWYYSLSGEYVRIFHALAGNLPLYVEGKLEEVVFEPAGTHEAINALGKDLDDGLREQLQTTVISLQNYLTRLVREASVETTDSTIEIDAEWELGQQLAEQVATYMTPGHQDMLRQGVAVSAGVGLSAAAAKKIAATSAAKLSAKIATTEASGLFAVTASKLGAKVLAGAGTGATTGATVCASSVVGAPASPACALVLGAGVGVGTWILVDMAVIEAEDLLHRETFENELRQALVDWRDELCEELRANYEHASNAAMDGLLAGLDSQLRPDPVSNNRDFIPAEAAAQPATY